MKYTLQDKNIFLVCSDDEHPRWKEGDEFINGCELTNDLKQAISIAILSAKSTGSNFIVQFKNSAFINSKNETETIEVKPSDNSVRRVLAR